MTNRLIAVDDGGDYLGLLLRGDSMVKLSPKLMHFHHETGDITPKAGPTPFASLVGRN